MSTVPARHLSSHRRGPRPGFLNQMRYGMLTYSVLALIAQRPAYGSAVVDALFAVPGMATSHGAIYPLLARLSRQGLLMPLPGRSGRGPRRFYRITEEGRAALDAFGQEWPVMSTGLEQILGGYEEPAPSRARAAG